MLSQGAARLGELSLNIHEEISEQNKILDQMEDDLDKATTTLNFVTARTKELIKRSGGKKNFIIIIGLTVSVSYRCLALLIYSEIEPYFLHIMFIFLPIMAILIFGLFFSDK